MSQVGVKTSQVYSLIHPLCSLSSSSATAIKKTPHCVSLKKISLINRGYKSFEDWNSDPNHVYIGRDMSHHNLGSNAILVFNFIWP